MAIACDAGVLLRLEPFDLGQQLAPARVELEHPVEPRVGPVAPPGERRAHRGRVVPDRLQVEHPAAGYCAAPEYFATKSATFWASSPTTMSCGIGPDEKPPFAIA